MPTISLATFIPAPPELQGDGLLGWVSFKLDGALLVTGVALRRSRAGQYVFSWPVHRGRNGRDHHIVRPLDDAARIALEAELLLQLDPWLRGGAA